MLEKIINFTNAFLDRTFVIIGAFVGSQIPLFMQAYIQHLSGRVAELNHLLNQLRQTAFISSKTLEQYIEKFTQSSDLDFSNQGQFMHGMLNRWQDLSFALTELSQSSFWLRPYYFFKHVNAEIAYTSLDSFVPGFAFTVEEVVYTLLGAFVGFMVYQVTCKGVRCCYKGMK